jgi:hypothetical protein
VSADVGQIFDLRFHQTDAKPSLLKSTRMGFLTKLFGGYRKRHGYLVAGDDLTKRLCEKFQLPDVTTADGSANLIPDEAEAIKRRLSQSQRTANKEMGGQAVFHPDIVQKYQKVMATEALVQLAMFDSMSDGIPPNWKNNVSTLLRAWAGWPDPLTLLQLSDLLGRLTKLHPCCGIFSVRDWKFTLPRPTSF